MNRSDPNNPETPVPPVCRPTVERLQLVLDGELEAAALHTDPHPATCPACRERIAAARLLLAALAHPAPVALPPGMTDAIVSGVREDRYARIRRRSYAVSIGVIAALAASFVLLAWLTGKPPQTVPPMPPVWGSPQEPDVAHGTPEVAPVPREVHSKPIRIGDELSKAGVALRDSPKAITDPAAAGSDVIVKLTDALTRPMGPMPDVEPARTGLAELPGVARTGLEPVTGTAEKAYARLLRDVSFVSVKPKS